MVDIARPADVAWHYAEAFNARDLVALGELFATDADFVNVVGLLWRNRTSIVRAHARAFSLMYSAASLTIEEVLERPVGEGVRVLVVRWRLAGQLGPDREPASTRRGYATVVLARQGEGWAIVTWQMTDIVSGVDALAAHGDAVEPVSYLPQDAS